MKCYIWSRLYDQRNLVGLAGILTERASCSEVLVLRRKNQQLKEALVESVAEVRVAKDLLTLQERPHERFPVREAEDRVVGPSSAVACGAGGGRGGHQQGDLQPREQAPERGQRRHPEGSALGAAPRLKPPCSGGREAKLACALGCLELSARELAVQFSDEFSGGGAPESSLHRLLKENDLLKSPEHIACVAKKQFRNETPQPNDLRQADLTAIFRDHSGERQYHPPGRDFHIHFGDR